eukprot:jgi/Mesvir1/5445/Mv15502-RA.3
MEYSNTVGEGTLNRRRSSVLWHRQGTETEDGTAPKERRLVGAEGSFFVESTLCGPHEPKEAIELVQKACGFTDPRIPPLVLMLEHMGMSRTQVYQETVQLAMAAVLRCIPKLSPERLLTMLHETFAYIGIPELRAVPIAVMERLRIIPSDFLRQLSADEEFFNGLPIEVQRQVWEQDLPSLQCRLKPLIRAFANEATSTEQMIYMSHVLPPLPPAVTGGGATPSPSPTHAFASTPGDRPGSTDRGSSGAGLSGAGAGPGGDGSQHRQAYRAQSKALRELVEMIGQSRRLYKQILFALRRTFADSGDWVICMLRSQLVMALHDTGAVDLCEYDACHKLAWCLDACLREGRCDAKHLREIQLFLTSVQGGGGPAPLTTAATGVPLAGFAKPTGKAGRGTATGTETPTTRGQKRAGGPGAVPSAGVAGGGGATAGRAGDNAGAELALSDSKGGVSTNLPAHPVLADAAMILRDPPVLHLLLHEVLASLIAVVEREGIPKDDERLLFLTQVLGLSLGARKMLKDGVYLLPPPDKSLLQSFFPDIAQLMLDDLLREPDEGVEMEEEEGEDVVVDAAVDDDKLKVIKRLIPVTRDDVLARKVSLMYLLQRLARGDSVTSKTLLLAVTEGLNGQKTNEEPEFARSLLDRLRTLLRLKPVATIKGLFEPLAKSMTKLLSRLCPPPLDQLGAVVEVAQAASSQMPPGWLLGTLEASLAYAAKTRKKSSKRKRQAMDPDKGGAGDDGGGGGGEKEVSSHHEDPAYVTAYSTGNAASRHACSVDCYNGSTSWCLGSDLPTRAMSLPSG